MSTQGFAPGYLPSELLVWVGEPSPTQAEGMDVKSFMRTAYRVGAGEDPLAPPDDRSRSLRIAVDPRTGGILALALALLCGLVVAWTASSPVSVHAVPQGGISASPDKEAGPSGSRNGGGGAEAQSGRRNIPVPDEAPAGSIGLPGESELVAASDDAVIVYVSGEVAKPGIVRLARGARVVDAVEEAGGMTGEADPNALNLARILSDGEHIVLTRPGEAVPPVAEGAPSSGPVSLSLASAEQLEQLPGIGPSLARRIIDYRDANGPFSTMEDLLNVSGIGESKLAALTDAAVP